MTGGGGGMRCPYLGRDRLYSSFKISTFIMDKQTLFVLNIDFFAIGYNLKILYFFAKVKLDFFNNSILIHHEVTLGSSLGDCDGAW